MKTFIPWLCLLAVAPMGFSAEKYGSGIENYREGRYFKAVEELSKQNKYSAVEAYYLARMNLYGYGQLRNNEKAIRYFTQAAEGGFLPAQETMGLYSLLEKHSPEAAFYWFKKAADMNNDMRGEMYCASAYLTGYGVTKNVDKAREYYIAAAKQGNAIAQYAIAENFLDSRHGGNNTLGLIWLNKASEQENPRAEILLSKLLAEGKLVPKDVQRANALIDKVVAKGNPEAMVQKGKMALMQNNYNEAKEWFTKAMDAHYLPAYLTLSELYLNEKSPLHNPQEGYLLVLKAAEKNYPEAMLALAKLYKEGKVVRADEALAAEMEKKARAAQNSPAHLAALWLSNGNSSDFSASGYFLKGILTDWRNKDALRENIYNPFPEMLVVTRDTLFKPNFVLTKPNEISINEYYDVLVSSKNTLAEAPLKFAPYPMDSKLIEFRRASNANTAEEKANLQKMVESLKLAASLGDGEAEFHLGQLYEYGFGVQANHAEAIKNYELSANQEGLPAMYAMGLLYINGSKDTKIDLQKGIDWLQKAAFKGNGYAQFALARLYERGFSGEGNKMLLQPDPKQSEGMYHLAAADNNGAAQYRLAELLVRKKQEDVSVNAMTARQKVIKSLYAEAVGNGVNEAVLPLAFFNAMDNDVEKQKLAFQVAQKELELGENKEMAALLLGLMYDRGIGVEVSKSEAMGFYAKAGNNPVSNFILGTYYCLDDRSQGDVQKGKALLEQSANQRFPYANLNVAVLHQKQNSDFIPQLEMALASGNSKAGLLLADYYLSIASDEDQIKKGRDIYQMFAAKGDKDAQVKLAFMNEQGLGGKVDYNNALALYDASAAQGQPLAEFLLGRLYQVGFANVQPDYAAAKKWYKRSATHYAPASVALGFLYDTVDDDYRNAEDAFTHAANAHDANGQFNLGLIYEEGKGHEVDIAKAKQFYLDASSQGHAKAMVRLAGLEFNYLNGSGDPDRALAWYTKAAEKGDRDAFYHLGLLSEAGIATPVDHVKALSYFEQSARLGSQQGMLALARMYQFGVGVAQNQQQAAKYYEKLAGLGNAFAQYQLANLYNNKLLPETKPGEGKKWLMEAIKNGNTQASYALQMMSMQKNAEVSYIHPINVNQSASETKNLSAELMYMDALNHWDCGDEVQAKMKLNQIHTQFPNYVPVQQLVEKMGGCVS